MTETLNTTTETQQRDLDWHEQNAQPTALQEISLVGYPEQPQPIHGIPAPETSYLSDTGDLDGEGNPYYILSPETRRPIPTCILEGREPRDYLGFDASSIDQLTKAINERPSYTSLEAAKATLEKAGVWGHSLTVDSSNPDYTPADTTKALLNMMMFGLYPDKGVGTPWVGSFADSGASSSAGDYFQGLTVYFSPEQARTIQVLDAEGGWYIVSPQDLHIVVPNQRTKDILLQQLIAGSQDYTPKFKDTDTLSQKIHTVQEIADNQQEPLL